MAFVTIENIAQHVTDMEAEALLASGGRASTAHEAAETVNRATYLGWPVMHHINEDFKRIYGIK